VPNQWIIFWYDLERPHPQPASPQLLALSDVQAQLPVGERPQGMPFLIGPDGRPDHRVNAFFASRAMRTRSALTWRKYGYCLGMWLNFLLVLGKTWDQATADDAEYFKEWRLTEEANPRPVESITFAGNVAALRSFYRWAGREFGCPIRLPLLMISICGHAERVAVTSSGSIPAGSAGGGIWACAAWTCLVVKTLCGGGPLGASMQRPATGCGRPCAASKYAN